MGLDFETLSAEELVAAESAVLTMRSLMDAVKAAPHGQGMACVEAALHEKGFAHLRTILATAVASHEGAQKKGPVVCPVPAGKTLLSSTASKDGLEQRRAHRRGPAVLRLPPLQGQADALGKLGGDQRHAPSDAARAADDRAGRQPQFLR